MDENNLIVNRKHSNITTNQSESTEITSGKIEDEFASAFPQWDLLPPAILIKRVRRGI